MSPQTAKIGARILTIAGWLLILWGTLLVVTQVPVLYALLAGHVVPGPVEGGPPIPTVSQQGAVVGFAVLVVVCGFLLRFGGGQVLKQTAETSDNSRSPTRVP